MPDDRWEQYVEPVQTQQPPTDKWAQYTVPDNSSGAPSVTLPTDIGSDAFKAAVHSQMLGIDPGMAYTGREEIDNGIRAVSSDYDSNELDPTFVNDLKAGFENSIIGLKVRNKLPDAVRNTGMVDKFVTGLSQTIYDLPIMLLGGFGGGFIGGIGGSEAPIVGNITGAGLGASAGAFALPSAMREVLVQGIKNGDVKSFPELLRRSAAVVWAGVKGGLTGLATEASGLLPVGSFIAKSGAASTLVKGTYQFTAMTTTADLLEGKLPTKEDFAVNAAMFVAMHYTMSAFGRAETTAGKVHETMLDMYQKNNITPQDIAAEALARAQSNPEEDPIDRINNIAREVREANPQTEPRETSQQEPQEEKTVAVPPDPGLRPAIRDGDQIIEGRPDSTHDETFSETGTKETPESERGFVDSNGNFYTREEATSWVRQNEPEVGQALEKVTGEAQSPLRSEEYTEARQRATGIKNASVDAQRAQMGLPPIEGPMRALDPDNWDVAKEDVDSGRVDPLRIAESVNENPRNLSPEETNAMNYYRARLSNEHKTVMDSIEKARSEDNPRAEQEARSRLQDVENRINTVDAATKRAGTEWALTGQMRQRMISEDYSLDRLLQRARIASKTGEVSPEIRDKLESLSNQLEAANKAFEEYRAKESERQAQLTVDKLKSDAARTQRKGDRVQVRTELRLEFNNLIKDLDSKLANRLSANPFLDPELLGIMGKLAVNRVESGLSRIEDIVDDIHGALTNIGYEVNKRDVRDAISGYGKTVEMSKDAVDVTLREAKRQGKLISALEDAEAGKLPERSGLQRDESSDRVRELQKQVKQVMRESGIDARKSQTPERQWKTALDSVKSRLRNQIDDLTKQIKTGEKEAKRTGIVYDDEANLLKEQRDALRETYRQTIGESGKREISAEQRIKMASAAIQKQISEYERRIKEKDLTPAQRRAGRPEPRELSVLRDRLDALRETYRQTKEAAEPKKTPEQIALQRFKTYTQKRIADMEERLKTGDFTKEPARKPVLDEEANQLKIKSEKLRQQVDEAIAKQEYENRTPTQKALHAFSKWRRATLLAGFNVFGKLGAAAMSRMGVTPIEELIGGVLSRVPGISRVAERAPFEGKPSISAEAKALSQIFDKATREDTWEELKNGKISLDYLYGDKEGRGKLPPTALDFIGNLHGAIKVLPRRAEFFRRLEIGTQWAIDNHLDTDDPRVQSAITAGAYQESLRSAFMQDNVVATAWSIAMNYLHNKGVSGQAIEAVSRTMLPIVKVPSNILAESLQYNPANLGYQTIKLFQTLFDEDRMGKSAMDNLTMHDMDNIMRGMKKGTVGLALLTIGYALRDKITGYYGTTKEDKRKLGTMKIGGAEIPAFLQESPALATLQMGATVGHVWDHYQMKGMSGGLVAGAAYATSGEIQRVPFLDTPARIAEHTRTPESLAVFAGSMASSIMNPAAVQQIARWTDPEGNAAADAGNPRKPTTATQSIEMGIPGLREDVPFSGQSGNRNNSVLPGRKGNKNSSPLKQKKFSIRGGR